MTEKNDEMFVYNIVTLTEITVGNIGRALDQPERTKVSNFLKSEVV
jgi:hypothetical protein